MKILLPLTGAAVVYLLVCQQVVNGAAPYLDLRSRTAFGKYSTDEDLLLTWSSVTSPDQLYSCILNKSDSVYSLPLPLEGDESVFSLTVVPMWGDPSMVVFSSTVIAEPDCVLLNMGTIRVQWRLVRVIAAAEMGISNVPGRDSASSTLTAKSIAIFRPKITAYESTVSAWEAGWGQLEVTANHKLEVLRTKAQQLRAASTETISNIHQRAELVASSGSISSFSDLYVVLVSLGATLLTSATLSVMCLLLEWVCSVLGRWLLGCDGEGDRGTAGGGNMKRPISSEDELFWSPSSGSDPQRRLSCDSCDSNTSRGSDSTGSLSSTSSYGSSFGGYASCSSFTSATSILDGDRAAAGCTDSNTAVGGRQDTRGESGGAESDSDELFTLLLQINSFSSTRLAATQQVHQQRIEALFREERSRAPQSPY